MAARPSSARAAAGKYETLAAFMMKDEMKDEMKKLKSDVSDKSTVQEMEDVMNLPDEVVKQERKEKKTAAQMLLEIK